MKNIRLTERKESVEKLYNILFSMKESIEDIIDKAQDLDKMVEEYGGITQSVISEQINKYFIPALTGLASDKTVPGSIVGITAFLDSLPLYVIREEPQPQQDAPQKFDNGLQPNMPAQTPAPANPTDAVPHTGPTQPAPSPVVPAQESLKRKKVSRKLTETEKGGDSDTVYHVIRTSKFDTDGTIHDVAETVFDTCIKKEAEAKVDELNATVTAGEKKLLGTKYVLQSHSACEAPQPDPDLNKKLEKELPGAGTKLSK